jgi:hypothetical protein
VSSATYDRQREILRNIAVGLSAASLLPSGGGNNPEAATIEPVDLVPPQSVPVPTAFTERFNEVEKVADKAGVDLPTKLLAMTCEDNPTLVVPEASPAVSPQQPPPGTTAVDLSETSSSSSSTSDSPAPIGRQVDPDSSAAAAALKLAKAASLAEPAAVATVEALAEALGQARAAARAATQQLQGEALEEARAAARAATEQMEELD